MKKIKKQKVSMRQKKSTRKSSSNQATANQRQYSTSGLTAPQKLALKSLGDIYITHFAPFIGWGSSKKFFSNNGAELQSNLKLYGLSHQQFFAYVEQRIKKEFDNVLDARFDYSNFLLSGIYVLRLNYVEENIEEAA